MDNLTIQFGLIILLISFVCELFDATVGMGFGTTLTPLLILLGFDIYDVVPAVLLGQIAGGISGSVFHAKYGHIDFRNKLDRKIILILSITGIIGGITAALLSLNLPKVIVESYIGIMIISIGIIIIITSKKKLKFSFRSLYFIGLISAFNKGISGGGYGPLVTGGQLVSGRESKKSVGSTTISELIVCISSVFILFFSSNAINYTLSSYTSIGAFLAGPLAANLVKRMKQKTLKTLIGSVIITLGIVTFIKLVL